MKASGTGGEERRAGGNQSWWYQVEQLDQMVFILSSGSFIEDLAIYPFHWRGESSFNKATRKAVLSSRAQHGIP